MEINWDHSEPGPFPGQRPAHRHKPFVYTDFSVVMNARTGLTSDSGECNCWPLPLDKLGPVVGLPATC